MDKTAILYHNPNCSKSRAALALLEENDVSPQINYYLDTPLTAEEIQGLLSKLNLNLRQILRESESEFEQYELDDESLSDEIILDIVVKHPILIQRPIFLYDGKAIIGRPPETVLSLLKASS